MKSDTEKNCQKEKKEKRKKEKTLVQIGFNICVAKEWENFIRGVDIYNFKMLLYIFVGIAYQGKKDIVFRLFIIESIVASWIFFGPPR
jgi:hypothetical protein